MTDVYEHTDPDGDKLTIAAYPGHAETACVRAEGFGEVVLVPAADLPEIVAALYKATRRAQRLLAAVQAGHEQELCGLHAALAAARRERDAYLDALATTAARLAERDVEAARAIVAQALELGDFTGRLRALEEALVEADAEADYDPDE